MRTVEESDHETQTMKMRALSISFYLDLQIRGPTLESRQLCRLVSGDLHILNAMASSSLWQRFQQYILHYGDLDFSIDISRMKFPDDFFDKMRSKTDKAFAAMREL